MNELRKRHEHEEEGCHPAVDSRDGHAWELSRTCKCTKCHDRRHAADPCTGHVYESKRTNSKECHFPYAPDHASALMAGMTIAAAVCSSLDTHAMHGQDDAEHVDAGDGQCEWSRDEACGAELHDNDARRYDAERLIESGAALASVGEI